MDLPLSEVLQTLEDSRVSNVLNIPGMPYVGIPVKLQRGEKEQDIFVLGAEENYNYACYTFINEKYFTKIAGTWGGNGNYWQTDITFRANKTISSGYFFRSVSTGYNITVYKNDVLIYTVPVTAGKDLNYPVSFEKGDTLRVVNQGAYNRATWKIYVNISPNFVNYINFGPFN